MPQSLPRIFLLALLCWVLGGVVPPRARADGLARSAFPVAWMGVTIEDAVHVAPLSNMVVAATGPRAGRGRQG